MKPRTGRMGTKTIGSLIFLSFYLIAYYTAIAQPNSKPIIRRNILWFDATANFQRFSHQDSIQYYLQKSREAGITDVVIDVKPISGEVLYNSRIAPVMKEWNGFRKKEAFDLLTVFIREAHRRNLRVHAAANVFVAGHNYLNRGLVFQDTAKAQWQTISYLPQGLIPITQQKKKYSVMLNPALPDVQQYELSILEELVRLYPSLDGLILDRVRYDGIEADFSPASRKAFEKFLGHSVSHFPEDIYRYASGDSVRRIPGPLYQPWLKWRAKVIHDFIGRARRDLKQINPRLSFGDYTGSWYPTYYEVGVNWASRQYDPSKAFAWASPDYKKYGYAEALDLLTTGCYYFEVGRSEIKEADLSNTIRTEAAQGRGREDWYTVEGAAMMSRELVKGVVPVYAGLYVAQYQGHPEQFVKALRMCRLRSDGVMIFDIVHIIQYNWWKELQQGLLQDH